MVIPSIKTVKLPETPSRDLAHTVAEGVTIDFLTVVFAMSRPKVVAALMGLRRIGQTRDGAFLYSLPDASARLVKPTGAVNDILKNIKVQDLPDHLREPVWNAKLKQQRYEKNAGELWRTEAVIQLFGSVLKDTKERIRLINTMAEAEMGLSPHQLAKLREIVNSVQGGIHQSILELESKTPSSVAELNREYGAEEDADYDSPTNTRDEFEY